MVAALSDGGLSAKSGRRGRTEGHSRRRQVLATAIFVAAWFAVLPPGAVWAQSSNPRSLALELYVRGDEHNQIREWLAAAVEQRPGVSLRVFDVGAEGDGRTRHEQICKHFKKAPDETVPAMYACAQLVLAPTERQQLEKKLDELRTMKVFVRSGCPRCANMKAWLNPTMQRYPGFNVVYRDVVTDGTAQTEMNDVARRYSKAGVSVPMFWYCDQVQIGFDSASGMGKRIEAILDKWTFEKKAKPANKASRERQIAGPQRLSVSRSPRAPGVFAAAMPVSAWTLLWHGIPQPAQQEQIDAAEEIDPTSPDALPAADEQHIVSTDADNGGFELPLPADVTDSEMAALPLPSEVAEEGEMSGAPANDEIAVPMLGSVRASRMGLPAFTVVIGLVDGFNPCAMWVLLFLLSILVNLQNRWKILAVAGSFVFVSGVAYFLFMALTLNVVGMFAEHERAVQLTLGSLALLIGAVHVKDFFAFKKGVSFSIPESAKSGIAARVRRIVMAENLLGAIVGAVTLAVLINMLELLCTAGLPALFVGVLQDQGISGAAKYGYLGLYNLAYMFDDALMVMLVVITLDKTRLQEKQGRWLKLVSGAFVLALGVVMIVKPSLLQFV